MVISLELSCLTTLILQSKFELDAKYVQDFQKLHEDKLFLSLNAQGAMLVFYPYRGI